MSDDKVTEKGNGEAVRKKVSFADHAKRAGLPCVTAEGLIREVPGVPDPFDPDAFRMPRGEEFVDPADHHGLRAAIYDHRAAYYGDLADQAREKEKLHRDHRDPEIVAMLEEVDRIGRERARLLEELAERGVDVGHASRPPVGGWGAKSEGSSGSESRNPSPAPSPPSPPSPPRPSSKDG